MRLLDVCLNLVKTYTHIELHTNNNT